MQASHSNPDYAAREIEWLESLSAHDVERVGGKAANLGRLIQLGHAVPPGFAITVDAFRAFVRANDLEAELGRALTGSGKPGTLAVRIKRGSWPRTLRRAIVVHLNELTERMPDAEFAVRSSATDEDGQDASFAGQHATVLEVKSEDAILDAIRICWASLLAPEALRYRSHQGKLDGAGMGVVVQAMVDAEMSGVLFTLDPVSGDHEHIVINSIRGLGEALVSGKVTPDHDVVRKSDLAVLRRTAGDGVGVGVGAVLNDDNLRTLAEVGRRVELEFGEPQDIEWAARDGRLWLLQSRPITGAGQRRSEFDTLTDDDTQWTSTNIQEVMPGLLSPLTQSLLLADFADYTAQAMAQMGIELRPDDTLVGSFYGRAFMNLTLAQEIGGQAGAADEHYFTKEDSATRAMTPAKKKSRLGPLQIAVVIPKAITCFATLSAAIPPVEQQLVRADRRPLGILSMDELLQLHHARTSDIHAVGSVHVLVSILSGAFFTGLQKICEKWLGDRGEICGRLCKALPGMESAEPAYALWRLAEIVRASPALTNEFSSELTARKSEPPADPIFRASFAAFMSRYGHHSTSPMELAAASWDEDAPTILGMIRNYLRSDASSSPEAISARSREDRERCEREGLDRLGFFKRMIFRFVLGRARAWMVTREHTKSMLILAIHRRRKLMRELERRLVGLAPRDLYYLTWDEVRGLCRNALGIDRASALALRRRTQENRNRSLSLPETFRGRPKPTSPAPAVPPSGGKLEGIAVSSGVVTGRARVILDPQIDSVIEPGEILVAPVTDAGWAPLFTVAAGLVVDIGGTLSHGSTVAREYGIPAVVNVRVGTELIKTGDLITVDGSQGIVYLKDA